jgi:hypothetical protein
MAVTINADDGSVSGSAGLKYSSDSTGVLALQTNGTTAVSVSTGQVVTLTQPLPVASGGTGSTTGVTPAAVSDQLNTSTGYFDLPTGTTAERPGSPVTGMVRFNTTESKYEIYISTDWFVVTTSGYPFDVTALIVAGGGAGGDSIGGGGGAGGLLYYGSETPKTPNGSSIVIFKNTAYTVTVGAGGTATAGTGNKGSNSVFSTATALGGGGGGSTSTTNGGSGGGGGHGTEPGYGGLSTAGQGNDGAPSLYAAPNYPAGGGGGAGAAAVRRSSGGQDGGNGANGLAYSITGSSATYAGGGGAAAYPSGAPYGTGGTGGGGAGNVAGTANTGGGGGATKNGGSGIVILKIVNTLTATFSGGVTSSLSTAVSGFKIYTITATSTTSETVTFT